MKRMQGSGLSGLCRPVWAAVVLLMLLVSGCDGKPWIIVVFETRHGIQVGDRLLMNDIPIGQVTDVSLRTSRESALKVTLEDRYRTLINASTVFTFSADPVDQSKNCLICKNCDEVAAPVAPGQEYRGKGILRYAVACMSRQMDGGIRQTLETEIRKVVEAGEDFSAETLKMMEELAATNHEAFEKALKDAGVWVERLDEDARRTLEELRETAQKQQDEINRPDDANDD